MTSNQAGWEFFFINYPKQNAYLRVNYLDRLAYSVHDYVWVYKTNVGHSPTRFTTAHRSILHATKSKSNRFYKNQVAQPYQNPRDRRVAKRIQNGLREECHIRGLSLTL